MESPNFDVAVSEELVLLEENVRPVKIMRRTTSGSHGDKKMAYPVLQVVGGPGHSPSDRHNSSTSGSSGTSVGSKSRKSSEESWENRGKSMSVSSGSANYWAESQRRIESERPSIDSSIKLIDQEEEEEEDLIPSIIINSDQRILDNSSSESSFYAEEKGKWKSWSRFQSSLACHNESLDSQGIWSPRDSPLTCTEDAGVGLVCGHPGDRSLVMGYSLSNEDALREDSPNFGFHRIASDQLIVTKKKPPKFVGPYLFGELLGEGAHGKVKECLDTETLCRRAVKILKGQRLRKILNGEENLQKEIRLLRSLHNPHCISLVDVLRNEVKQKTYLVMELCAGSLEEMLGRSETRRFPAWQAQGYFAQLVEGLEYLRQIGVVHKDIKPSNLLLSVHETLKISDFGVAEHIHPFTGEKPCTKTQGTPKFQGTSKFCGYAVDVWSSGVSLYNLLSGQYPFDGATIILLYENIARMPLQMPSNIEIDSRLGDLLRGLLEKDPERRMKINDVKKSEWMKCKLEPEEASRIPLPPLNGDPARSLTVFRDLESLYDSAVQSPALSAQNVNEMSDCHPLSLPPDPKRLDITSSDEALTFAVSAQAPPPNPLCLSSSSSLEQKRKKPPSKGEHGKFCKWKQRFCTIQ